MSTKTLSAFEKFAAILEYFHTFDGTFELINMMSCIADRGPIEGGDNSRVFHI